MSGEVIPSGYITSYSDNYLQFHLLNKLEAEGILTAPRLLASVIVSHNMELTAFFKSSRVPDCIYKHLLSSKRVDSASGLTNVLALCKSMCMGDIPTQKNNYYVELAVSNLKDYVSAENVLQETGMKGIENRE